MRMSKKRLKYYYVVYLRYVARSHFNNDKSSMAEWLKGHNYGMAFAYGYALGYSDSKIESDLYHERKMFQSMLERIIYN